MATGEPIVGYGVRCAPLAEVRPAKSGGAFDALAFALRARSHHRGGLAELRGLRPGRNLLLVEPDDKGTFAPMAPIAYEVGDTFAERLVVCVPRAGRTGPSSSSAATARQWLGPSWSCCCRAKPMPPK